MNWKFWRRVDDASNAETLPLTVEDPAITDWTPDYERYKAVCDALAIVRHQREILAGEPPMAPWNFLMRVQTRLNDEAAKALGEPFK